MQPEIKTRIYNFSTNNVDTGRALGTPVFIDANGNGSVIISPSAVANG